MIKKKKRKGRKFNNLAKMKTKLFGNWEKKIQSLQSGGFKNFKLKKNSKILSDFEIKIRSKLCYSCQNFTRFQNRILAKFWHFSRILSKGKLYVFRRKSAKSFQNFPLFRSYTILHNSAKGVKLSEFSYILLVQSGEILSTSWAKTRFLNVAKF